MNALARVSPRRIAIAVGLVVLVLAGVPVGLIVEEAAGAPPAKADVLIVLGNKVELSGQPSARLAARLDRALELHRAGVAPLVIVSGGTGVEGHDEAKVMAAYLTARGIPKSAVIEDPAGWDTSLTARNAARIMRDRGLRSAVAVSQWFHLYRCRTALARFGVTDVTTAAPAYWEIRDPYSLAREVPGIVDYWLR